MQLPLPTNANEFNQRRDEGKARLNLLVNEIARLIGQILGEYHTLPKKLQALKAHKAAQADMQSQLQSLIHKWFVVETDHGQLAHFPRYLKAVLVSEWQQAATPWQRALKSGAHGDPKMQEFRWMLEELRVSLFAQELKTPMPVSVKRLQKVWESMQR
jgi:ATP-dependent helicase HrpA